MDLIQSNSSSASKLPAYIRTSILAPPPNLETILSKHSSTTSSPASSPMTFLATASSLSASLTSPTSGAHLCTSSIASNIAQSSHISFSATRLAKCGSTLSPWRHCVVCSITQTEYNSEFFFSSPLPNVYKKKKAPIPLDADPPSLLRVA
jgi:hypothetical protein